MRLKKEILKNSGLLNEGIVKASDDDKHLWRGEVSDDDLITSLENSKCAGCGDPMPLDGFELRPHDGDIIGFRGKNYHRDCFTVPRDANNNEKISFLSADGEGFIVANISDDWDGAANWGMEDED